jgi:O-antigen ligase
MLSIPCIKASTPGDRLERTLHIANSALVFWFFAFLITGPKNSHATTALLALSLVTLPATLRIVPRIWNQAAPWLVGLSVYCAYQIAYRLIDGGLDARIDPPSRYLGAIPILFYLARYGFNINALWAGLAIGSIIGGVAGAHEVWVENLPRAGVGHHPIAYGSLLAILSMSSLYGATIFRETSWRILLSIAFLAGLTGVLLSGTRGLYPALAACMAFIGYRTLRQAGVARQTVWIAAIFSLFLTIAIGSQIPAVKERLLETQREYAEIYEGNLDTSIGHRLQMWHAGLFIISEQPLFGLGPDVTKRQAATEAFMEEHQYGPWVLRIYDHLHNLYINEAATFGLIGLSALAGLLFGALKGASGPTRTMISLAITIILLEGLTETILNHHRLMMTFVILATLVRAQLILDARTPQTSLKPSCPANSLACDAASNRKPADNRVRP